MLFLAHQQGHTVSVDGSGEAVSQGNRSSFMLMGTGISILLAVLLR